MTLQELYQTVNQLSPEERTQLRAYLEQEDAQDLPAHTLSPEERARKLDAAFNQLREGLTPEEIKEMTEAMNSEYIESWDESEWTD
jgi:hypothetical protein